MAAKAKSVAKPAKTTSHPAPEGADEADGADKSQSNTQKDPHDWATGDEPMTGAQKSYLHTLSDEAGVETDEKLTKGEASQRIHELKDEQHVVDHRGAGDASNTEKDPSHWATGGEPMTGAQKSYLKTLSDEAGLPFDDTITKGEASKKIDELRKHNPRTAQ